MLCDYKIFVGNVVKENADGVGSWGGICRCPDGETFKVGDNNDSCGSLACFGGEMVNCNNEAGAWSGRKVYCGGKKFAKNVVEENVQGVGGWGGECKCPDGQIYQVGDNGDSCGSLACVNGKAGTCTKEYDGGRAGRKVTCGGKTHFSVIL